MKIICIGRNYVDHAKELGNAVPSRPLVFMKPSTAMLVNDKDFYYPEFSKDIHYEAELVIKIGKNGKYVQPEFAADYVDQVTVGLDMTARDIQATCKEKSHPWEIAKAFDHSAVLGRFVDVSEPLTETFFSLKKNDALVQEGNTKDMIFSIENIIVYVSQYFKLQMGDMIFTGTPAGVGPIQIGDVFEGYLYGEKVLHCQVK